MATTYTTAVKALRMTAVRDAIDVGGGGYIEIGTAGMATVVATISLAAVSGTVSGAVLTFTMPKSDLSADASGTAAAARVRRADATDIVTGLTVGLSATDLIFDSVSFVVGGLVTVTSATITHA